MFENSNLFQSFVGAMGVPGGGRNEVTERFLRHMFIITVDSFDDNTLSKIFVTILDWHFQKGFVDEVARLSKVRNSYSFNNSVITCILSSYFSFAWLLLWRFTKQQC